MQGRPPSARLPPAAHNQRAEQHRQQVRRHAAAAPVAAAAAAGGGGGVRRLLRCQARLARARAAQLVACQACGGFGVGEWWFWSGWALGCVGVWLRSRAAAQPP
jgi:hypothetical protein